MQACLTMHQKWKTIPIILPKEEVQVLDKAIVKKGLHCTWNQALEMAAGHQWTPVHHENNCTTT